MMTGLEKRSVWCERRVSGATAVGVLLATACLWGCSKRHAEAPNPEPAAAAPPPPPAQGEGDQPRSPAASETSWPGAAGAAALNSPKGEAPAEKKAATPAPEPANEAAASDRVRDKRSEAAPRKSAPATATKPKANISLGQAAKEDDDPLAEWGQSVALLEQSFDEFEDALALATPDCPAADKFRQAVCTLAEHICSLEQELPNTTKRRCDDGRQRCTQAGQKYRARCDKE